MALEARNRITRLTVDWLDNGKMGEAILYSVDDIYDGPTKRGSIGGATRRVTVDGRDGTMSMQDVVNLIMASQ